MNCVIYSFIITSIAGLSTLIGSIVIFLPKKNEKNIIISSLAFAAGVMLMVSFSDLIPNSYFLFNNSFSSIFSILLLAVAINIGIILSNSFNRIIPDNKNKLYKTGILVMLAIIMHNIPEGIATYITNYSNVSLGITLSIAIAAHNIPEGISISVPIYFATKSKKKAILYTFISGVSELFGAVLAFIFLKPYINDLFMAFLYAIISGIMLYLSIFELFRSSINYKRVGKSVLYFILGIIFILLNHFIF